MLYDARYATEEAPEQTLLFRFSSFMFRISLALATFEQIRPFFDVQISDYCLFAASLLLLRRPKDYVDELKNYRVLLIGLLILSGSVLSLSNTSSLTEAAGPLMRLFVLFGVFAPLAVIHSKSIRKNMLFLMAGIFVNCFIALIEASVLPGIVDALSIHPTRPDMSASGRLQALTSHPNILGFSAALAVLIAIILFTSETSRHIRGRLIVVGVVCTIAALLSGSRTFFVAVASGLVVFAGSQKLHRAAILRTLVTVFLFWFGIAYIAPNLLSDYSERLSSTGSGFAPDESRYMAAALALVEISQKPILGWGPDHLDDAGLWLNPESGEMAGVHNSFLAYWHGVGILGALGFVALFLWPALTILRLLRTRMGRQPTDHLHLALACLGLLFVVSNLHPILYNRFLFIPVFCIAGFAAHLQKRLLQVQDARIIGLTRRVLPAS